jgi:hypothetical protein
MQKVAEKMGEVDRANTAEMKEILNVHGWMRIEHRADARDPAPGNPSRWKIRKRWTSRARAWA